MPKLPAEGLLLPSLKAIFWRVAAGVLALLVGVLQPFCIGRPTIGIGAVMMSVLEY